MTPGRALGGRIVAERRLPRRLFRVVTASLLLVLSQPGLVAANWAWEVVADRSTITRDVPTSLQLTIRNTSDDNDPDDAIGCVEILVPSAYVVNGATIDSVSNGKVWNAAVAASTITVTASNDANRVFGSPDLEIVVVTIDVVSSTLTNAAWSAAARNTFDCNNSLGSLTIPMTVVAGANAIPVANDDSATFQHDSGGSVAAPGVLTNDTDADGNPLTAVLQTPAANGSVSLAADGSYLYTPNAGYVGPDSFTYRASDGIDVSAPATVSIDVTNSAPTAAGATRTVSKNVTLTEAAPGLLGLAADGDGDGLTALLDSPPANGTLSLGADGAWAYDPAPGYSGPDAFTWHASDGLADSSIATLTLDVVNDAPLAVDDTYSLPGGLTLSTTSVDGVLANDADANGDGLTASAVLDPPDHGSLLLAADGGFTYVPVPLYRGIDTFAYELSDGTDTATATVTIHVGNSLPTAVDDAATTPANQALDVVAPGVLGNDADADGDPLTAVLDGDVAHGSLALDPDGSFSYTPDAGYRGPDSFTYRAGDGAGLSGSATVSIDVTNNAPLADNDDYETHAGTRVTVTAPGLLVGDSDAEGDPLTARLSSGPASGTLALRPDGSFDYTPDPDFLGTDHFWYVADDGLVTSAQAKVRIAVTDAQPIGVPDSAQTPFETTLVAAAPGVLANDDDPDPEDLVLSASLVTPPAVGSLSLAADGSFTYVPAAGFSGPVTFQYGVCSRTLQAEPTLVTITVKAEATASAPPSASPEPSPESTPNPAAEGPAAPGPSPTVEPSPGPSPGPSASPGASPTGSAASGSGPGASGSPPAPGGGSGEDTFSVEAGDIGPIDGLIAATLGGLAALLDWAVPAFALTVPGLLLIIAVLIQAAGGLAWLPIARRSLRGDGAAGRR